MSPLPPLALLAALSLLGAPPAPAADGTTPQDPTPEGPAPNEPVPPPGGPGGPPAAPPAEGQKAPEIEVGEWLNFGEPLNLEKLRGRIVVLEFWATWCGPCLQSIPHLVQLHQENKGKGVVVLGVSDEKPGVVKPFMKKMKMEYIVGVDEQGKTQGSYGINAIPQAFLIDPQGAIVWSGHPLHGLDEALKKALQATPPTKGALLDLASVKKEFEEAVKRLEKGEVARAGKMFKALAESGASEVPEVREAARRLARIEEEGKREFDAAVGKWQSKDYLAALEALTAVRKKYEGLAAGVKAAAELVRLEAEPDTGAAIRAARQEADARTLLQEGLAFLKDGREAEAAQVLDRVAEAYPGTDAGTDALAKIEEMKKDPAKWKEIEKARADLQAKKLLSVGQTWKKHGYDQKAKEYFEEVVKRFPETDFAKEAEAALAQ